MKYIIDTDKLPCNNGQNCTSCSFWGFEESCSIKEQVKKLPVYEERPHGEWEGNAERRNMVTRICTSCGDRSVVGYFCMWCGADMRTKEGDQK